MADQCVSQTCVLKHLWDVPLGVYPHLLKFYTIGFGDFPTPHWGKKKYPQKICENCAQKRLFSGPFCKEKVYKSCHECKDIVLSLVTWERGLVRVFGDQGSWYNWRKLPFSTGFVMSSVYSVCCDAAGIAGTFLDLGFLVFLNVD